jgi:hypothetical protein
METLTVILLSACGTRAKNLSAPFSYTLYGHMTVIINKGFRYLSTFYNTFFNIFFVIGILYSLYFCTFLVENEHTHK